MWPRLSDVDHIMFRYLMPKLLEVNLQNELHLPWCFVQRCERRKTAVIVLASIRRLTEVFRRQYVHRVIEISMVERVVEFGSYNKTSGFFEHTQRKRTAHRQVDVPQPGSAKCVTSGVAAPLRSGSREVASIQDRNRTGLRQSRFT